MYNALYDYLITVVRKAADDIIRMRVFLSDRMLPSEDSVTTLRTETSLTILKTLVHLPPFSVMRVSLDVRIENAL